MQRTIAQIHHGLARLLLLGFVIQVYLATAPLFGVPVTFQHHRMLGSALAVLVILLFVLALAGRLERQWIRLSALLVVLTIVQVMLPSLRGRISWIAALHAVNALALIRVAVTMARSRPLSTEPESNSELAQPTVAA
jgi:hypothetical protein